MKRKVLAFLLIICTLAMSMSFNVLAETETQNEHAEIYVDTENQYILERKESPEGFTVYVKSIDGRLLNTITNSNGKILLDGTIISDQQNTAPLLLPVPSILRATSWGPWQYSDSGDIATGGLAVAIIAGFVAAYAPWVPVKRAAEVAGTVAGKYDTLLIKWQTRFGSDATYNYYERKTNFYGDGKKIGGTFSDKGKERK